MGTHPIAASRLPAVARRCLREPSTPQEKASVNVRPIPACWSLLM
jgi:hypothetical protein